MYHISILGHADEDDYGERLGDIARISCCPASTEDEIADQCEDADVIVCRGEIFSAELLERLEELKLLVVLSSHYDNIDLAAAARQGITVINNPLYCVEDIADHTCAMMLSLLRRIPEYQHDIRETGKWQYNGRHWPLHRVGDNVIGLVGFGRTGQAVAKRMHAFGCRVLAYDPFVEEKTMMEQRVKPVGFDALLSGSDVISLHIPLNDTTRNLFQEEQFEQMKDGSMFVNCCRGGLADEAALFHAIDDGHIRSAALDVMSLENPSPVLLKMFERPEFLLTPRCAHHSLEGEAQLKDDAIRFIRSFLDGDYEGLPIVTTRE